MAELHDIGRYKVLREIGSGGMAQVYLAYDPQLQCNVALKVLTRNPNPQIHKNLKELFAKEAQVLAQLNHPNVIRVFDLNLDAEDPYISMEYVDGLSLSQYLKKNSQIGLSARLKIFTEICNGVAAIHAKGVVHRDLKPENVMVSGTGAVKVMDFGIVEDFRNANQFIVGTPAYMAPEQVKSGHADARSDIFSLGIIGAILFTGKNPFRSTSLEEVHEKHKTETVNFPSTIPVRLKNILESCLRIDARNRPTDVHAVLDELAGVVSEAPKKVFAPSAPAMKFLFFSVALFAGSLLYRRFELGSWMRNAGSREQDLNAYYSAIEKCFPNCEGVSQTLTKPLVASFPRLKCGDGICSYLEQTCGLCAADCGMSKAMNWRTRPACITFYTPAATDPVAREARAQFDSCSFSLNPSKDASPQAYVTALIACVRNSNNALINACAKQHLSDAKESGPAATKFALCVLKDAKNF